MNRVSIIIPSRDRLHTLRHSLATCLAQDYPNLEIIVSNNCSTDSTHEFMKQCTDHRVRYVVTNQRVSMSDNWEFALAACSGDYIIFIGDDDGMCLGGITLAMKILQKSGADCIGWNSAHFGWPDHPVGEYRNHLRFSLRSDCYVRHASIEWSNFVRQRQPTYGGLFGGYANGLLPRRLFDDRKREFGKFFRSSQPDIFAAIVATRHLRTQVYTSLPLSIAGGSASSNGAVALQLSKEDNPSYLGEQAKFMEENRRDTYNRKLSYYRSLTMAIADAWLFSEESIAGEIKDVSRILRKISQWGKAEIESLQPNVATRLAKAIDETLRLNGLPVIYGATYKPSENQRKVVVRKKTTLTSHAGKDALSIDTSAISIADVDAAVKLVSEVAKLESISPVILSGNQRRLLRGTRVVTRLSEKLLSVISPAAALT